MALAAREEERYPMKPFAEWDEKADRWRFYSVDRLGDRLDWRDSMMIFLGDDVGAMNSRAIAMNILLHCFPDEFTAQRPFKSAPKPRLKAFSKVLLERIETVNGENNRLKADLRGLQERNDNLRREVAQLSRGPAKLVVLSLPATKRRATRRRKEDKNLNG